MLLERGKNKIEQGICTLLKQRKMETQVRSLGQEDPLGQEMTTHWRIPWTEEPGRLQSMGSQRVGHDWRLNSNNNEDHLGGSVLIYHKALAGNENPQGPRSMCDLEQVQSLGSLRLSFALFPLRGWVRRPGAMAILPTASIQLRPVATCSHGLTAAGREASADGFSVT